MVPPSAAAGGGGSADIRGGGGATALPAAACAGRGGGGAAIRGGGADIRGGGRRRCRPRHLRRRRAGARTDRRGARAAASAQPSCLALPADWQHWAEAAEAPPGAARRSCARSLAPMGLADHRVSGHPLPAAAHSPSAALLVPLPLRRRLRRRTLSAADRALLRRRDAGSCVGIDGGRTSSGSARRRWRRALRARHRQRVGLRQWLARRQRRRALAKHLPAAAQSPPRRPSHRAARQVHPGRAPGLTAGLIEALGGTGSFPLLDQRRPLRDRRR